MADLSVLVANTEPSSVDCEHREGFWCWFRTQIRLQSSDRTLERGGFSCLDSSVGGLMWDFGDTFLGEAYWSDWSKLAQLVQNGPIWTSS